MIIVRNIVNTGFILCVLKCCGYEEYHMSLNGMREAHDQLRKPGRIK